MWWLLIIVLLLLLLFFVRRRHSIHVVISRYNENVSWKDRLVYQSTVYEKNPVPGYRYNIPVNKGQEAPVYFKYILDNYYALPDYIIFLHGHETSWHQNKSIVDTVNSLWFGNEYTNINDTKQKFKLKKDSRGFNITDYIDNEQIDTYNIREVMGDDMDKWWKETMEEYFGSFDDKVTTDTCCAQFVVSKNAILRHPLSFYEKHYNWLLETDIDNKYTSRFYEWTWKYIFTCNSQSKKPEL